MKIGLAGYLGYSVKKPIIGGQMSKTVGIYNQLKAEYKGENIYAVDTSDWKKSFPILIIHLIKMAFICDVIIIMPNKNGIKFILPFFSLFKKICGYKIAYPVVGGWLPNLLKKHTYIAKSIKSADLILPETVALKNELKPFCKCPIEVMPVFSTRNPIDKKIIPQSFDEPISVCTFSRVTKAKGIDDAIVAAENVNKSVGKLVCRLDVFGPIDNQYAEHYEKLFADKKAFVTYKGILSDNSLEILSQYYMLIFPTFYHGEGFPITICESFMSALPVLAYDWRFNNELISNGNTGYLVDVHDITALAQKLLYAVNHKDVINKMRLACYENGKNYQPQRVMKYFIDWLNSVDC